MFQAQRASWLRQYNKICENHEAASSILRSVPV